MNFFIYFSGTLAPTGGPSGYLMNLKNGLLEQNPASIKIVGSNELESQIYSDVKTQTAANRKKETTLLRFN